MDACVTFVLAAWLQPLVSYIPLLSLLAIPGWEAAYPTVAS